jgi:hypothetical protein
LGFENLLITHHVKNIVKVLLVYMSLLLFFVCSPLSAVGIPLLVLLPLVIGFAIKWQFVNANVEDQISSSQWED